MAKTKFSEGTTFGIWFPVQEGSNWRIKRMVTLTNGKRQPQRLDRKTYLHIPNSRDAIQSHCDRLNYGTNISKQREKEIKSAFIPETILIGFRDELRASIENPQYADYLFEKALKKYCLDYFINQLKLPDPRQWAKRQIAWGQALRSTKIFDEKPSARTITLVVQTANRFLSYLHRQMPEIYPALKLNPVSKQVLKLHKAEQSDAKLGKFINEMDWTKIQKRLPSDIEPFICLMYHYGLRRSESLGFQTTDSVRQSHLFISHQLKEMGTTPIYKPLKSRDARKTPHWFCKPADAYRWISKGLDQKMHPDTLSEKWDDVMIDLGMDYGLHDFRRTFITRALREQNARDVQLAVGHSDLRTTMKYAQDDRDMADEVWKPSSKVKDAG